MNTAKPHQKCQYQGGMIFPENQASPESFTVVYFHEKLIVAITLYDVKESLNKQISLKRTYLIFIPYDDNHVLVVYMQ